jgi:polyhydroxyalkanoate synthesis regulator phasin
MANEPKTISLEQFLTSLNQAQLGVYQQKETYELQQRRYFDLVDTLAKFAVTADNENKALREEIESLKKRIAVLESNHEETAHPVAESVTGK